MIRFLTIISVVLAASMSLAQNADTVGLPDAWDSDRTTVFDAATLEVDDLIWLARPVVVFADSPNDPRLRQQLAMLAENPSDLAERDVIILTDTDPSTPSALRLRLRPRGFMLVIMGKDGEVELRKPAPWTVREISRTIDKMPLRQQEIEDRRAQP